MRLRLKYAGANEETSASSTASPSSWTHAGCKGDVCILPTYTAMLPCAPRWRPAAAERSSGSDGAACLPPLPRCAEPLRRPGQRAVHKKAPGVARHRLHGDGAADRRAPAAGGFDLFFVGGGQDFEQGLLLEDLRGGKGADIRAAAEDGAAFLCVCGGYQLMGHYYDTARRALRGPGRARPRHRGRGGAHDRQLCLRDRVRPRRGL